MPLEEVPLKAKQRLNTSELRIRNQYVFEQMGLSMNGSRRGAVFAIRQRRREEERTLTACVNVSQRLAQDPVTQGESANLPSFT